MSDVPITKNLTIFGKSIPVKGYLCAKNGCPYQEKPDPLKIQLVICPTFHCGAHCPFCVAAGDTGKRGHLDPKKLERLLSELEQQQVIRGISITGGEPMADIVLLDEIIEMIFNICGVEMEISINTNGSALSGLRKISRLPFVDAVHISRHHYDDVKNQAYFGIPVARAEEIRELSGIVKDPKLFCFNCLLLKDGIGSTEEMFRFLDFTAETGIPKAGFVTPMVVNPYVEQNRVSYEDIFPREDPRVFYTKEYCDYTYCRCRDGVYATDSGKLVEFYGRETMAGGPEYARVLVYGADDVLRTGYGEKARVIYE